MRSNVTARSNVFSYNNAAKCVIGQVFMRAGVGRAERETLKPFQTESPKANQTVA